MSEPSLRPGSWFDAEDAPTRRDLNTCIHCGLCLTACPTYRELKIEPDSPRGRIYLMRGLAEGRIAPDDDLVHHLDLCLDCRACEPVCPAGVPYSRMLEETRGQLARRRPRRGMARMLGEWALKHLLPHRDRMHLAAGFLGLGQVGPMAALMRSPAARSRLPRFMVQGFEMTPPIEPRAKRALSGLRGALPPGASMEETAAGWVFRPSTSPRARVAFFTSCVMDVMFPRINRETVRMLVLFGCEVVVPRAQTCCGALHAHAGMRREAKALARRNLDAFGGGPDAHGRDRSGFGGDVEFIVSHSAGCGAALREMGHLLGDDPRREAAESFSSRVRDVAEVLAHVGQPKGAAPVSSARNPGKPLRVGYHDPCHLAHAQRVRQAPRLLLRGLPGVELVDLPNSDWCCGSAGIYNLAHPEMAEAQLEHKLDSIAAVEPEVVVASNPGCLLHMRRGAKARGMEAEMVHLVEVLGRAFPEPSASRPPAA